MGIEDWKDVLHELAVSKSSMVGLPASNAQRSAVFILFKAFYKEADVRTVFAADESWFRHEAMKLLWGHSSTGEVDMATLSVMIDELGEKNQATERWELTDRGRRLLYAVMDELEEVHPTQLVLV